MIRALLRNAFFGYCAWGEATLCAAAAQRSIAGGLLMLFFCLLSNQLLAAWAKGHP